MQHPAGQPIRAPPQVQLHRSKSISAFSTFCLHLQKFPKTLGLTYRVSNSLPSHSQTVCTALKAPFPRCDSPRKDLVGACLVISTKTLRPFPRICHSRDSTSTTPTLPVDCDFLARCRFIACLAIRRLSLLFRLTVSFLPPSPPHPHISYPLPFLVPSIMDVRQVLESTLSPGRPPCSRLIRP